MVDLQLHVQSVPITTKVVSLNPVSSWEIQKTFIVEIVTITGYPSTVGNGEIGPSTGKATIIVSY
jgi:hypothetical protein